MWVNGFLAMPLAVLALPVYMYLPSYYAEQFGLSLTAIGLVLFGVRLSDVITDAWVGRLSDSVSMGRAQQMLLASFGLILGVFLIFNPPIWAQSVWGLAVLSFGMFLAWTWVNVPYQAMLVGLASASERARWSMVREGLSIVAVLVLMASPVALDIKPTDPDFFAGLSGVFAMVMGGLMWIYIRRFGSSRHVKIPQVSYRELRGAVPGVFRIMPSYFINNLANALPAVLFVMFVTQILGLESQVGILLLSYFLAGVLALPLWLAWAKRKGALVAWRHSMILASLSFACVLLLDEGDFWGFWCVCVVSGLSLGVDLALPSAHQADLAEQANQALDKDVSATVFGLWGLLVKLSMALAVGLALPLVEYFGTSALWLMYAVLPIFLKLTAVGLLLRGR